LRVFDPLPVPVVIERSRSAGGALGRAKKSALRNRFLIVMTKNGYPK